MATRAAFLAMLVLVLSGTSGTAREIYRLGGSGYAWEDKGTLSFADPHRHPGAIQPFETELSTNLAVSLLDRGGDVGTVSATEAIPTDWKTDRYSMVDGDSTTAFVHEPQVNIYGGAGRYYTVDMRFNLGAPFPVERLRLRTRPDYPKNLLRIYQLWVNDGSEETKTEFGDPIWTLLRDEPDNLDPVVDLQIEPQIIQHIRIRPWEADVTWEMAELEVYGQGYVPQASFVSEPLDLGGSSSLGRIWWSGHTDPGAKVTIQTRTGWDDQPEVYWRRTGIGSLEVSTDERGTPLTLTTYNQLSPVKKGRITQDLENWSVWQTYGPDSGVEGTRILSPSPRRYVQIRIDFQSAGQSGGRIDSLWFEYSQPPVVREVVGEISPERVMPGALEHFTYFLRVSMDAGQRGFDVLELRSPAHLEQIEAVRIEATPVAFSCEPLPGSPPGTAIHFPRVARDQTRIEVDLSARVFRYGTVFDGAVVDSQGDEIPLSVTAGNVADDVLGDVLSVRTTLQDALLGRVIADPNPFSPNGDGVNDRTLLRFDVLRLTRDVPISACIHDLSGRRIRRLARQDGGSSFYEFWWDGLDDSGGRVPPGIYLYRIEVDADDGTSGKVGQIAVAY